MSKLGITGGSIGHITDVQSFNPFGATTITDNNAVIAGETAVISFTAANGMLIGAGLGAGTVKNGKISYTLTADSPTNLQSALQSLVFIPTAYQLAAGNTITTHFSLKVTDSLYGNSTSSVSASGGVYLDSLGNIWTPGLDNAINTSYLTEFSGSGRLIQQFSHALAFPQSLAVDSRDNVWLTDQGNNVLEEFSAGGQLLHSISKDISNPHGLTVDSSGNVWVIANFNEIEEFSADGRFLQRINKGVSGADNLCLDSQGHIWVANYGNNSVAEFSAAGRLLHTLFNGVSKPYAIAADSQGNVWVSNLGGSSSGSVEEFSADGKLLQTLSNGINSPQALAVDSLGNVWVANYANSTVEEFSSGGHLMQTLSDNLFGPALLSIDSQGNVWVGSQYDNSLAEFSASGKLLQNIINGIYYPTGLAITSYGNVWVANSDNANLAQFSPSGLTVQTIDLKAGIFTPVNLAFDSQGNIWLANAGNNSIEELSPNGLMLQSFTGSGGSTGIYYPKSVTADKSDHVWIASADNSSIEEYTASGQLLQTITGNGLGFPDYLCTDGKGGVWVANAPSLAGAQYVYGSNTDSVTEFSASGQLLLTYTAGMAGPDYLTTDSNGDLWVVNKGYGLNSASIEEFSAANVLLQTLNVGLSSPESLSLDGHGDAWVANAGNNTLEEFAISNGTRLLTLNLDWQPTGSMTFDQQGNLWLAGSNALQEIKLTQLTQHSAKNTASKVSVTETAAHYAITPNANLNQYSLIKHPHHGDSVTINDADTFIAAPISRAEVKAAGGNPTSLAGWVNGALSNQGADLPEHSIGWFKFAGDTYLVEQANPTGTAYGAGDSLVKLVGLYNEHHAVFDASGLTLA